MISISWLFVATCLLFIVIFRGFCLGLFSYAFLFIRASFLCLSFLLFLFENDDDDDGNASASSPWVKTR